MEELIDCFVGPDSTIWDWIAFIVNMLIGGGTASYAIRWMYEEMGWSSRNKSKSIRENGKKQMP